MLTVCQRTGWRSGGVSRRAFLRAGTVAGLGLSLGDLLRASERPASADDVLAHSALPASFGRAKRCVLLFLTGGPPQLDTWDMKPEAPAEIRGELGPIATNVPGIQICELFPRLAERMDKCCLVRSVTHADTVHTSAGYTLLTGAYHPTPNLATAEDIRPGPDDHPHLGSLVSLFRDPRGASLGRRDQRPALPPFVTLPEIIQDAGVNTFPGQDAGFLGKRHSPLLVEADDQRTGLRMPDVFLPSDVTTGRLSARRDLWAVFDKRAEIAVRSAEAGDLDGYYARAFSLVSSASAREAFDLACEPDDVRAVYGAHLFGQGCLLARRLLEAGVSLVTVYWHYEGPDDSPVWDTHQNNFPHLRNRLIPPTDQALAALLDDLSQRGLLDETLVICLGEFGRSPRINGAAGRDHWPQAQTILLAGAGVPAGSVYGATDRHAAQPADSPVTPPDLTATFLHLLGVPSDLILRDLRDRPIRACDGTPVRGLVG
jgi:hypothetical protein